MKVLWQDAEPRANPLTLALEPGGPNAQAAPLSVNNNQPVTLAKDKTADAVTVEVKPTATPGTFAVVLRGDTPVAGAAEKDKKKTASATAFAPPIDVTVLPTTLAKVTVTAPDGNALKPGGSADLTVKVERQFDYAGPFAVSVKFPPEAKGLAAKDVTLPAGADEVKVLVTAAADAKPGGVGNVAVTVTATVHGKYPVPHEAKVNVTVAKLK